MSFNKELTLNKRILLIILAAMALAGLVGWIVLLSRGSPVRAWGIMLVNFLFFTCLSAGMTVWPAILFASNGRWQKDLIRPAAAGISFMPASFVLFAALALAVSDWAPWSGQNDLPNRAWLNAPFLLTRDIIALALFWGLAVFFIWKFFSVKCRRFADWFIVVFCGVFALMGFDLVMALSPHWKSSLFGGYFFISSLYIALAGWTLAILVSNGRQVQPLQRNDLALLMVTFSILTAYLMFSQLLPIWYENLPQEVIFLIPRMNAVGDWRWVSIALLASFYLGPLVIFVIPWFRYRRNWLLAATAYILAGMWLERWWLVAPTLGQPLRFGWVELACTVFVGSVFVLGFVLIQWLWPARFSIPDAGT